MDVMSGPTLTELEGYVTISPHKKFKVDCSENKNILDRYAYDGLMKIYSKIPRCP